MKKINVRTWFSGPHLQMSWWVALMWLLKLLIFDVIWCVPTTFKPLSMLDTYLTLATLVLLLTMPVRLWRLWRTTIVIMALMDVLLVANLMYFRTYFAAIPLANYSQAGNLADFMSSVWASLRWVDALLPLTTVVAAVAAYRYRRCAAAPARGYLWAMSGTVAMLIVSLGAQGGFVRTYDAKRQKAYLCSSMPVVYSVFGSMAFDWLYSNRPITEADRAQIEQWLAERPPLHTLEGVEARRNCVFILCESLESWVIGKTVEGQEITPNLNRLLQDSTTLYAPRVLSQVKGGRSIDGQLILLSGLLPINNGTYSAQYQYNTYFTLPKAMRQRYGARSYLLTVDKPSTWNQGQVAQAFGIDTILDYTDFTLDESFGTHRRLADRSFLRQAAAKIAAGEVWKDGEHAFIQLVTYSGHHPFVLPEEMRELHFSDTIPEVMADYMALAHYTDSAIGEFVSYLQTLPQYGETLVVITGDHEGLADARADILRSPAAQGVVSTEPCTPLIVLNSPVASVRYNEAMGQVDVYPTLLQLLGVTDYPWQGLGQSILDADKAPAAVLPTLQIVGDSVSEATRRHLKSAFDISDKIIRFDYLRPREH
ncbi:MAG: LTA synthase family protein [Muribaculaceae bacterium]